MPRSVKKGAFVDVSLAKTIEAMNKAKEAGVPILVAINKSDKPNFDASNLPGVMLSVLRFDDRQTQALRVAVASRIQAAHSQKTNGTSYISQAVKR